MSQDSIAFIALAILGITAFAFRKWYLNRPKSYVVSKQLSAGRQFIIMEHNPRFETAAIGMIVKSNNELKQAPEAFVEFLNKSNKTIRMSIKELSIHDIETKTSPDNKNFELRFEKRDLMRGIRNADIQLYRFRFVVKLDRSTLIKSHIFEFSRKYMLLRPDIGKYTT